MTQGFLRLIRVTVERVTADRGSFLYFSDDQSQLSPTVVLTFVDMRQTDCSSLVISESPSARLVLQQVSSSCANDSITSDVGALGCDQRYTDDILGVERGVCASAEPEACSYTISSSLAGVTWCAPSVSLLAELLQLLENCKSGSHQRIRCAVDARGLTSLTQRSRTRLSHHTLSTAACAPSG